MDAIYQCKTGTITDNDVRQLEQLLPLVPSVQLQKCVAAHQQTQRLRRTQLGAQFLQSVHCVAGCGALNFTCIQHECRLIGDRQLHHRTAVLGRYLRHSTMRRRASGNEANMLEIGEFKHFLCETQMSEMDRVKRAAQNSNGFFAH